MKELLLREAFELKLLFGIRSECWILVELFEHLLVKGLGQKAVGGLLLHDLDLRLLRQPLKRLGRDIG